MKHKKLQTKRKAQQGFRALYARTVGRKVRAAAVASADELDGDVPNVGIGKALTVILILHVLAIGAICLGTMNGNDEKPSRSNSVAMDEDNKSATETGATNNSNTGLVHVETPLSYNIDGEVLDTPLLTNRVNSRQSEQGVNNVEPRQRAPRVIKPKRDPNAVQQMVHTPAPALTSYTIQKGDTFYRLAKKFNIKQQELMDLNPNVNASRMRIGMEIKVPNQ